MDNLLTQDEAKMHQDRS